MISAVHHKDKLIQLLFSSFCFSSQYLTGSGSSSAPFNRLRLLAFFAIKAPYWLIDSFYPRAFLGQLLPTCDFCPRAGVVIPFVQLHELPLVSFPGPVLLSLCGSAPSWFTSQSSCFVSSANLLRDHSDAAHRAK